MTMVTGAGRGRSIVGIAIAGMAAACVGLPPAAPGTDSDGEPTGAVETESTEADTTLADSGPVTTSGTESDSDTDADSMGTETQGSMPVVSLEESSYDYGLVDTGEQAAHVFTITNKGTVSTSLNAVVSGDAFGFPGGYPGGGTCGESLGVGEACTVEVVFAPDAMGPHPGDLVVAYEGQETSAELTGGGRGSSQNLLLNPGGEQTGNPPPHWLVLSGSWLAGAPWDGGIGPVEGANFLASYEGVSHAPMNAWQDVSTDPWTDLIERGVLRFSFAGMGRNFGPGDDEYRMRIHYLDGRERILSSWDTDWSTSGSWQQHEDARLAPVGTQVIRVLLSCRKSSGNFCDAFFDRLELSAVYP